jgi:hypothetical protein
MENYFIFDTHTGYIQYRYSFKYRFVKCHARLHDYYLLALTVCSRISDKMHLQKRSELKYSYLYDR